MTTTIRSPLHHGSDFLPRRAVIGGLFGAAGLALVGGRAAAGPLDPPAGPIAPTSKPLADLEPRTAVSASTTPGDAFTLYIISQPGSYYLTGNIAVPANKTAIRIAAPDVTLDLRGFTVSGNNAANTYGIQDNSGDAVHATIRNGIIEKMAYSAVYMFGDKLRFTDLTLRNNGGFGIITGASCRLERVIAVANATTTTTNPGGILAGPDSSFFDCLAESNKGYGIYAGSGALLVNCHASQNTGNGITVGPTSSVIDSSATNNGGVGISMQHSGLADSCTANTNTGTGIAGSFASLVRHCIAFSNSGGGVDVWEGALIARCSAGSNTGFGFRVATGCSITDSVATFNTGSGIDASVGTGSTIARCVTRSNTVHGINAQARCYIRENHCQSNSSAGTGAAGIIVTGTSGRIESNHCVGNNGYGIHVNANRNMITRNSCAENVVNWNFFSNCAYGPVINCTTIAVSGMSGNGTVASTIGSADPFANISV